MKAAAASAAAEGEEHLLSRSSRDKSQWMMLCHAAEEEECLLSRSNENECCYAMKQKKGSSCIAEAAEIMCLSSFDV